MISFVWPNDMKYTPWAGGSETYTLNHLKELRRRGIAARLIACNREVAESFKHYPDIPLLALDNETQLEELDDTIVFVLQPMPGITTKHQGYVIIHTPIKGPNRDRTHFFTNGGMGTLRPITTSNYMARYWKDILHLKTIPDVVYPAVDPIFSQVDRPSPNNQPTRILFAGRSTPEKGVYTLLASLHMPSLRNKPFTLSCVETMNNSGGGTEIIHELFHAHPLIRTVPARKSRKEMAELFANHDVVVMPSSSVLWKEAFGMISIEAQHAGCRVVASNDGGLPETDCGGLILVEPDNPMALANGISQAIDTGPLTPQKRLQSMKKFTLSQSVDALLRIVDKR